MPGRSQAQVLTQRNVSTQLALAMANAAIAACKADGYDVSVVVVDRAGEVKLLMRADTANPHNADLARRKAYTAHTFDVPSMDVAKRTNGPTELSGQRFITDIIPLGGGLADHDRHRQDWRPRTQRCADAGGRREVRDGRPRRGSESAEVGSRQ